MLNGMDFGTNLIRCSLHFDTEIENESILSVSWNFLLNHPWLEEFKLLISCEIEELDSPFTPLTLPNLKTLIVGLGHRITGSDEACNTMYHFMDSLDMQCLSKLVLSLQYCRDDKLEEWIDAFLPKPLYPNLVDLSLQALPSGHNNDFVESLLEHTPNVCNLTLLTPTIPTRFTSHHAWQSLCLPHLRKIVLMPCNVGWVSDKLMSNLLDFARYQGDGYWDDLDSLEIVQHDVRQPQLMTEEAFPSDKLTILPSYHNLISW